MSTEGVHGSQLSCTSCVLRKGVSLRKIQKRFPKFSLPTVYRHANSSMQDIPLIKRKTGRPKKVTLHDKRKLICILHTLRDIEKVVTSKKMQLEAGLTHPF